SRIRNEANATRLSEPAEPAACCPSSDPSARAYERERRLHHGRPLVARSELGDDQHGPATDPRWVLNKGDVDGGTREEAGGQGGEQRGGRAPRRHRVR